LDFGRFQNGEVKIHTIQAHQTILRLEVLQGRVVHQRQIKPNIVVVDGKEEVTELFGDYDPETMVVRVWMRTAAKKEVTSFGTFLSTRCHEFCHQLDYRKFNFADSWHIRGFYECTAANHCAELRRRRRMVYWVAAERQDGNSG
jgi:hypothetical protein